MSAESDRKSRERYIRENTKIMAVRFHKEHDKDIIDFMEGQPNKIDTLRQAIRLLMEMQS